MKITIACVGKIKESFYRDAVSEYEKRLGKYADLKIREVQDEKTADSMSDNEVKKLLEKEEERLQKVIPEDSFKIALCIDGMSKDSVQFADFMEELNLHGNSHITFVIGGSLGLSDRLIKSCDAKLSFSAMTFPHQLMRVILLEQIYRSFRIRHHEPYHK